MTTLINKETLQFPHARETYPDLINTLDNTYAIGEHLPGIILSTGMTLIIITIITGYVITRKHPDKHNPISMITTLVTVLILAITITLTITTHHDHNDKINHDKNTLTEHIKNHPDTITKTTALINTTGYEKNQVCDTARERTVLCGQGHTDHDHSPLHWGTDKKHYEITMTNDYDPEDNTLVIVLELHKTDEEKSLDNPEPS